MIKQFCKTNDRLNSSPKRKKYVNKSLYILMEWLTFFAKAMDYILPQLLNTSIQTG